MLSFPNINLKKYGEKLSLEYSWGHNLKENILHFFFQLIRDPELSDLELQLHLMLKKLNLIDKVPQSIQEEAILLYTLIGHTRDIRDGKGEYMLAYMQLWVWYQYEPVLAQFALTQFVQGSKYGSWKDIKLFCEYILQKTNNEEHPFILFASNLLAMQLKADMNRFKKKEPISKAAKWCPREKTRFKWLYTQLALQIYPEFIATAKTCSSRAMAICKAKIYLRKELAKMNKYLKTPEYIMCNDTWDNLTYQDISTKALNKYKLAFQNKTKHDTTRHNQIGRYICAAKLQHFIESEPKARTNSLNVGELVKAALSCRTALDEKIVNTLWNNNITKNTHLENVIPIIDTSSSMERNHLEPLYNAIGLGIRVSEISWGAFKNRLIIFSANPYWIRFEDDDSFVKKVRYIYGMLRGLNSNIQAVIKMLIDALKEAKTPIADIKTLTLLFFSDMQCDPFSEFNGFCLSDNIKKKFIKFFHTIPKIVFWNMRKTGGFPALIYDRNLIMLSGTNAKILNILTPRDTVKTPLSTSIFNGPYSSLYKLLNSKRYLILKNKIISKI